MAQARGRNQGYRLPLDPGVESGAAVASARKRARRAIESPVAPSAAVPSGERRRLSAADRQALLERRRARTPGPPPPAPEPEPAPALVQAAAAALPPATPLVSARPTPRMPSKAAPRMPRTQPRPSGPPRALVAVGAVLIAGIAVLALAGGRLFGSAGDDDPPRDGIAAAPLGTGIPALVLGSPVPAANPVPPLAPPATPKAVAFPGGRAPIVCLDPGHGGPDDGFNPILTDLPPDFTESTLVLQHAWDLEARLKLRGYDVVMTRRTDTAVNADRGDVNGDGKTARDDRPDPEAEPGKNSYGNLDELQARINVCNRANADLLVSMHVNGYSNELPYGPETWYTREREFGARNEEFAGRVYTSLKEQLTAIGYVLPEPERGSQPDTALSVDTEHATLDHLVITGPANARAKVDPSRMPGAVIETLFISNPADAEVLNSPIGRSAIVTGYENAIVEYFEEHPPGA